MAQVVDTASVPQLNGIFAPIVDEIDAGPLEVVAGEIPADLTGAYLRNGPNPRFTPLGSYIYPLDGDGMVHGVWFGDGQARYSNRFVRTPAIETEERAGRALWPGIMTGEFPTADQVGADLAGTERDLVDIHVVHHGGRLLALAEGARPFELSPDLSTIGPYSFDGALPKGMCAHPKVDPDTGEMVVFRYGIEAEPWLTWATVAADGTVARPETPIDLPGPTMIHDCAITPTHLVLIVCPVLFDFDAVFHGGSLLKWDPDAGVEFLAVPRDGGPVVRARTDAFWVWHTANAFDDFDASGRRIVIDYPYWTNPGMGMVKDPAASGIHRAVMDLDRATVALTQVDDQMAEFPRIDDRHIGRRHRWYHVAGKDPDHPTTVAGEWNRLLRYDVDSGAVQDLRCGERGFGEAVFVPRRPDAPADDGYLMTYEFTPGSSTTDLVLLDASDITAPPVARIRIPHRVPFGLHGTWVPELGASS
jgi:carotenoid cleavage dioxygenase-like enzyme